MSNIKKAFRLPNAVTIMGRSSSITNSFVNGIIPVSKPTEPEIIEAAKILKQDIDNMRCAYCGDKMTEWDHLNPLIREKHSTGYITEIANLVPSCGKCNQSKGNSNWLEWIMSDADLSPKSRGIADLHYRIDLIKEYENTFIKTQIKLEEIVGKELWNRHWENYNEVIESMKKAQCTMDEIKQKLGIKIKPAKTISKKQPSSSLIRDIQTIGMATFVKYYNYFSTSQYSRQEIISIMRNNEKYSENSLNTKVSIGIKIIKNNNGNNALEIIKNAKNIDKEVVNMAIEIIKINGGF